MFIIHAGIASQLLHDPELEKLEMTTESKP